MSDEEGVTYDDPTETPEVEQEAAETNEQEDSGEQEEPKAESEERARIEFTPEQQQYINEHIVGRQVAKRKEIERQLEELRSKVPETPPEDQSRPKIPDPPNVWDDDYEKKIQARDDAIRKAAEWDTEQRTREQYESQRQQESEAQRNRELMTRVQTYTTRAKDYGIDAKDLEVAGSAVGQMGIPNELTEFILDDDAGPAITVHLSRNLQEVDALSRMSPIQAAVHIATNIKPKALKNAKRRSAPPEPTDSPRGSGVPEKQRGPQGAVYE